MTKRLRLTVVAAVFLVLADRLLKSLALRGLYTAYNPIFYFSSFLNKGIVFSLPVPTLLFWLFAIPLFAALLYDLVRSLRAGHEATSRAQIFIVAGAASNLYDRFVHNAIIDYLIFFSRSAMNIADFLIIGGCVYWLWIVSKRQ